MENRFKNILDLLSQSYQVEMARRDSPYVIEGYKEIGENAFELEAGLHPFYLIPSPESPYSGLKKRNDVMILLCHPPYSDDNFSDDVFTIQIRHVFGAMDTTGMDMESAFRQYFAILERNIGSFFATGAYLGINRQGGMLYAYLEMMLHFLVEWTDEQVVRILSFQLAGMYKGLENHWDNSLTILRRF